MRFIVMIISMIFFVILLSAGISEFFFLTGVNLNNPGIIKNAQIINPFVSKYFYQEYCLSGNMEALRKAMRLEPSKPLYHMVYGFALFKQTPRTLSGDQEAVREICKAAALKPYSKKYQKMCQQYKSVIPQFYL